jgi:hypothetical protein
VKKPNEPYELELDEDGMNTDLAPALIDAARALPTYPSEFDRPVKVDEEDKEGDMPFRIVHRSTACTRCAEDNVVIWPDTLDQRVGHLTREHGYRMDGHRYDNANALVP